MATFLVRVVLLHSQLARWLIPILVEKVEVSRDLSRHPLFTTMFILNTAEKTGENLKGVGGVCM